MITLAQAAAAPWSDAAQAAGGVGAFLLGMSLMTESLRQLSGEALRARLQRTVGGPWAGLVLGVAMTVAMQASSATIMATMGFAAAGLVSLVAAIGIVAGATVGTTSTSWLVAMTGVGRAWFPWFMPMLLVGALLRFLGKGRVSDAGGFMSGFGLLLAGLNLLRPVMAPLVTSMGLMDASGSGLGSELALLAAGALAATIMQSSAAPIAIAMSALVEGGVSFRVAAPFVVGASVGTTSTALLIVPFSRAAGARVGVAWICISVVAALVALPTLQLLETLAQRWGNGNGAISLAVFHTSFTALGALAGCLLARPLSRLLVDWVPDRGPALLRHIDEIGGGVPAVVLEGLRRGVAGMGAVALRAADARMHGQPAPAAALLEDLRNAGRALRVAASTAGIEGLSTRDMERQVASLQAMEHVKAIRRMLQRDDLKPPPNPHGSFHDFVERASAGVLAAATWLEAPKGEAPSALMRKLVREAGRRRQAARLGTLEATGEGKVSVGDANAHLDAMRAIDTLVEHAWRLVSDLDVAITARDADDDAAIAEETTD
jgi:phosphate:Na+ symporter